MSDEYCEFVGPNSSPEEESAYLDPISMTSNNPVANNMQAEAETVYETPIPVPLTNSSKASERKSEKAIKSNLNQLRSTFHKSEAAGALSKAFKLPKKILSSDHFQFGKDANRRDSSISKQEESDIYVDAEDAKLSTGYKGAGEKRAIISETASGPPANVHNKEMRMKMDLKKRNAMASSREMRYSSELNDLNNRATDENAPALYLDFSDETQLDETERLPASSNEFGANSMGAALSKKTKNHNSKNDISQPLPSSNRYEAKLREKQIEGNLDLRNRVAPIPSSNSPASTQIGQRPLPPTPGWSNRSYEEPDIPDEYANIRDDEMSTRKRKSSMPNQPPPLPPAIQSNDDDDDDVTKPNNSVKVQRPLTSPRHNLLSQNRKSEQKIADKSDSSNTNNFQSLRKSHPIEKILKAKQRSSSLLKQLSSDSNDNENQERSSISQQQMSSNFETSSVITSRKSKTSVFSQSPSHSKENLRPPPQPPAHNNSPSTTKNPPTIPKKPSEHIAENQQNTTADAVDRVPKKPARSTNKKSNSEAQLPNKTKGPSVGNKSISKTQQELVLKPPRIPSKDAEPSQDSSSQRYPNNCSNSDRKRVGGYTLHKRLAERKAKQEAQLNEGSSTSQSNLDALLETEASFDSNDDNTYHTIDDDNEANHFQTSKDKSKLASAVAESLTMRAKETSADENVTRSASQKSNSSSTLPRSPKIKPKPRPNVPPPPRPTTSPPSPPHETKRAGPPSRPPPPSKQKIVEAKVRRHISASNDMFSSAANRPGNESIARSKVAKSTTSSNKQGKIDERYYSAAPDASGDTKSPTKVLGSRSSEIRDKKSKKEFAAMSLMKSKINKYAGKRTNEAIPETVGAENENRPEYWREDSFEDDYDDDIEGIYVGIDDDFQTEDR